MKDTLKYIFLAVLLCCASVSFSQEAAGDVIVKGRVTSKADGPLIAASVVETDANNRVISSTATDVDGNFVLKIKNAKNKLQFTYLGYKAKTLAIGGNRTFNVLMEDDEHVLDQVVVVAQKKTNTGGISIPDREISTAIQKIDTKEFEGISVSSIEDALQGRIAGLDIVGNSGDVGAGMSMRVRGTTSINAGTEPLIVLDGIPYETKINNFDFATANEEQYAQLLNVNPDDIQDITLLKDAASTAIWGSKGSNGVIMINTKRGRHGPTRVQYTYRLTEARQPKGMSMLNGDNYTMLMKQAYFNPQQNDNAGNIDEFNYNPYFSEYQNYNNNTDWVNEVTQLGITNDHYLTVSGGGERALFRVSAGYFDQTGIVIEQELKRFTTRMNLDYFVSNRIKISSDFSFTYTDNNQNYSDGDNKESLLGIAYKKMPNLSVYAQDAAGNNTGVYYNVLQSSGLHKDQKNLKNPVALADLATNNSKTYRILPTLRLQYDLLDPMLQYLRFKAYVSFDLNNTKDSKFLPKEISTLQWDDKSINRAENKDSESLSIHTDMNLTWMPKFTNKDNSLTVYGSFQTGSGSSNNQFLVTYGHPSGLLSSAYSEAYLEDLSSGPGEWRTLAFTGSMHYAYRSKYMFDFTWRTDGSTKYGKGNKFGNFSGISGRWNISDEKFMDWSRKWLSMLSIRPSWGRSGNQPKYEYLHYSRYAAYGAYLDMPAIKPNNIQLVGLKWETTTSYNIGMDLGFFDNKYTMDINYYYKRTEDLLFEDQIIPGSTGFGSLSYVNGGTMDNEGWEFNFHANKFIRVKDFSVDFNFNLSNYINTIIDLNTQVLDAYRKNFLYENGTYLTRIQTNNSYGSIYGFKYKGVYQYNDYIAGVQENAPVARNASGQVIYNNSGDPLPMRYAFGRSGVNYQFVGGDAIYEDINHDGSIDELDIVYLGNSNPKLNGGTGLTFRWKNLSCNLFANFRYGNKIVNKARMEAENMYTNNNQSVAVNWRWRKDGDETDMPRALYNYGYNWLGSDRYVEDGSFFRLKYMTFNYSVPSKVLKQFYVNQLNLYMTFNNLFCLTKYTGVDPEVGYNSMSVSEDKNKTPRSKSFTLGVTLGF